MAIYGLHTGHDACSAKIEGNKLVYSYELEKFNQPRYSYIKTAYHANLLVPKLQSGDNFMVSGEHTGRIEIDGKVQEFESVGYSSVLVNDDFKVRWTFNPFDSYYAALNIGNQKICIETIYHTTCHVVGSYCASPFAKRGEDAFVSMWDGGVCGLLFYVSHKGLDVEYVGQTTNFNGNVFSNVSLYWGPLKLNQNNFAIEYKKRKDRTDNDHLNWRGAPGILMAYQGLGKPKTPIMKLLEKYANDNGVHFPRGWDYGYLKEVLKKCKDEDVIASIYDYLGKGHMNNINKLVKTVPNKTRNIVLTGGCALNIKWNSYLRGTGVFNEVWAPPFPNDVGIALGAAATKMVMENKSWDLDWNVYSGQELEKSFPYEYNHKWKRRYCSLPDLAYLLYKEDEPVVFLHGRAELGPRALGHRSIIASPMNESMRDRLNQIKGRASYRPVAPMCMEEYAPDFFTPGTPDPFMLFDHQVKENKKALIPAVVHVDGTARLQTVSYEQESDIHELLQHFYQLSGIPMLCNTSANEKGKGFFPSIASALNWGGTKYVWAEDFLYEKVD